MQTYRQAQRSSRAEHRDGEIGAWRNIGIAYALDLNDPRALDAFDAALRLAQASSNQRGGCRRACLRRDPPPDGRLLTRGELLPCA